MSAVTTINPQVRQVEAPTALRELPGWLLWRYETHPGEAKPRKVPHYVGGGRRYGKQGSPEDRAKLTTFGVAREAAARQGWDRYIGTGEFVGMHSFGASGPAKDVYRHFNITPEAVVEAARRALKA